MTIISILFYNNVQSGKIRRNIDHDRTNTDAGPALSPRCAGIADTRPALGHSPANVSAELSHTIDPDGNVRDRDLANMKRLSNVELMLGQRRRHWINILSRVGRRVLIHAITHWLNIGLTKMLMPCYDKVFVPGLSQKTSTLNRC